MIMPKRHVETVFDLSEQELLDTQRLLTQAKGRIDKKYSPDGYNVGWNVSSVGGQTTLHAHLQVNCNLKKTKEQVAKKDDTKMLSMDNA